MLKLGRVFLAVFCATLLSAPVIAAEDEAMESGEATESLKMETPGLNADEVKAAVANYIEKDSALKGGFFLYYDTKGSAPKLWKLAKPKPGETVRNVDEKSSVLCVNMTHGKGKESRKLDIDFWVKKDDAGVLAVSQIMVHMVDKKPRYEFDENNQVVPVRKVGKKKTAKKAAPKTAQQM